MMNFLKSYVLCLGLLCGSHIFAAQEVGGEKIYLQPDQIRIEQQGMFIDVSGRSVAGKLHEKILTTESTEDTEKKQKNPHARFAPLCPLCSLWLIFFKIL